MRRVAACLLLFLASCGDGEASYRGIPEGRAIAVEGERTHTLELRPAQSLTYVGLQLRSGAAGAVLLTGIRPLVEPNEQILRIARLRLVESGATAPGFRLSWPPTTLRSEECSLAKLFSPRDYQLLDQPVQLALWFKAEGRGEDQLGPFEVIYRQDGELYRQVIELVIEVKVSRQARLPVAGEAETICLFEAPYTHAHSDS